jgi:site-specific recombinase XerD
MTSPVIYIVDQVRALLDEYEQYLAGKAAGTREAYVRTVRHLLNWLAQLPGSEGLFEPQQLTQPVVEQYLGHLEQEGLGLAHRARVRSTISNFAQYLIEEKGLLRRNPTRGIDIHPLPVAVPRSLSRAQRELLRGLIGQAADERGTALFALGYWAGCRVSELSWLDLAHTHVGPKEGWLHVGTKESKERDITLLKQARQPLYAYLEATRDTQRTYVFLSQRSERLTEEAIHYWFRTLKKQASEDQEDLLTSLTFNNLRYDFAERARAAGWSIEKVAHYMGYLNEGTPQEESSCLRSSR